MTDAIGYAAACLVAGYIAGTLTGVLAVWWLVHVHGGRIVLEDRRVRRTSALRGQKTGDW